MKKLILIIVIILFVGFIYNQYRKSIQEDLPTRIVDVENESVTKAVETDVALLDGIFEIDAVESTIIWTGSALTKKHVGTVIVSSGDIKFTDVDVSGNVSVNMNSLLGDAGSGLDNHLKSADFFDVEKYPEASASFTQNNNQAYTGSLTVKGIEKEIIFTPNIVIMDGVVHMTSNIDIDRTEWGVMFGSDSLVDTIKEKAISNIVNIEIDLRFKKAA